MYFAFFLLIFAIKCSDYSTIEDHEGSCSHGDFPTNNEVSISSSTTDSYQHCSDLYNVKFTVDMTTIDDYMFYGSNVRQVTLGTNVETIGIGSFAFCPFIDLTIQSTKISSIRAGAFYKSGLTKTHTFTLDSLGQHAFYYCTKVTSLTVTMHKSVPQSAFEHLGGTLTVTLEDDDTNYVINTRAFAYSGLASIDIPSCVTSIGSRAFEACTLRSFDWKTDNETDQTISSYAFYKCSLGSTNLIIHSTVSSIAEYAFANSIISSVRIEGRSESYTHNPTDIARFAFFGCSMSSLAFGNFHSNYLQSSFYRCQKLTSINFGNQRYIPPLAFQEDLITGSSVTINIPATIKEIGGGAFKYCTAIQSVIFDPNSQITEIPDLLFYGCTGLTTITNIPKDLTSIGSSDDSDSLGQSFYNCAQLSGFDIPEGVEIIRARSFMNCKQLQNNLVLPNALTDIGESAFEGCGLLETGPDGLIFSYDVSNIGDRVFYGCSELTGNLKILSLSINTVPTRAFYDCHNLDGELFLQYLITTINQEAFYGCSKLTGEISPEIQTVNEGGFYGCAGLTGQIPCSTTNTKKHAFYGCSGLTGPVTVSSTVPHYAYYNCIGLESIIITGTSLTINDYAFYGCSGLKGEIDASALSSVGKYAFAGCSGLTGPLIFGTISQIDDYAFSGCSGFSNTLSFNVPGNGNGVLIGRSAFEGCSGFKDGTLSIMVTSKEEQGVQSVNIAPYYRYGYFLKIGNNAFEDTKFKNIYYLGRFQPDCDHDIGFSKTKGIKTSSNYANKTFCSYPLHKNSLSGGAIAGIVIACIVVVAAIVILIVFLILRNKKKKDNSEAEVEMNQDP